jgi:hypothetical protein
MHTCEPRRRARENSFIHVRVGLSSMTRRRVKDLTCTLHPSVCSPHAAHVAHVLQLTSVHLPHFHVVLVDGVGRERDEVALPLALRRSDRRTAARAES